MNYKVGVLNQPISTGNQSIQVGFAPKLVVFLSAWRPDENGSVGFAQLLSWTIGPGKRAMSYTGTPSTTVSQRIMRQDCVFCAYNTLFGRLAQADLISFDVDGFTLGWTLADSIARRIGYLAIGGDELSVGLVNTTTPSVVGSQVVTGAGFQPSSLLALTVATNVWASGSEAGANASSRIIGMADDVSQYSYALRTRSANNPSNAAMLQKMGKVLSVIATSSESIPVEATVSSFDADGCTLDFSAASTVAISYLMLDGVDIQIGSLAQPLIPEIQSVQELSFRPGAVIFLNGNSSGSISNPIQASAGFVDENGGVYSASGAVDHGATSFISHKGDSSQYAVRRILSDGTTVATAQVELADDGFDLNWLSVDAQTAETAYLAFASSSSPDIPLSVDVGADQVVLFPSSVSLLGVVNGGSGELSCLWEKISGPGTVVFSAPTMLSTEASFSQAGVYVLRLSVTDSLGIESDDTQITLQQQVVPVTGRIRLMRAAHFMVHDGNPTRSNRKRNNGRSMKAVFEDGSVASHSAVKSLVRVGLADVVPAFGIINRVGSWEPPDPPEGLTARGAVLMNADTGSILWSKDEDDQWPQASTTKLMTALLAYEYDSDLSDIVTISAAADAVTGTIADVRVGETIVMSELLRGLMLPSGNDAAHAIGEHIGQTYLGGTDGVDGLAKFVVRMNARAIELGLMHTSYANPHGLDNASHYTSARDLAVLARTYLAIPALRSISATLSYAGTLTTGRSTPLNWKNTNRALGQYPGTVSGKTGTTVGAKQCLGALHSMGGHDLIVAILGSDDRYLDATAIWEYGHDLLRTQWEAGVQGRSNTAHVDTTGSWLNSSYFPGSYPTNGFGLYSSTAGATATYRFFGTGVQVITSKSSSRGRFDISLDGGASEMIELYSPTTIAGEPVWEVQDLPLGFHTIVLTVRADRHDSSSSNTTPLEDFVVTR